MCVVICPPTWFIQIAFLDHPLCLKIGRTLLNKGISLKTNYKNQQKRRIWVCIVKKKKKKFKTCNHNSQCPLVRMIPHGNPILFRATCPSPQYSSDTWTSHLCSLYTLSFLSLQDEATNCFSPLRLLIYSSFLERHWLILLFNMVGWTNI